MQENPTWKALFAKRLRTFREKLNLTQDELAEICKSLSGETPPWKGACATSISRLERGQVDKRPKLVVINALAAALKTSPDALIGEDNQQKEILLPGDTRDARKALRDPQLCEFLNSYYVDDLKEFGKSLLEYGGQMHPLVVWEITDRSIQANGNSILKVDPPWSQTPINGVRDFAFYDKDILCVVRRRTLRWSTTRPFVCVA